MSEDGRPRVVPNIVATGLRGRCPRCGEGHLFDGFLTLRPRCERCGLDYGFADAADGPAFFATLISGVSVMIAAVVTQVAFQPPAWVHAVLWLPAIVITSVGPLRPLKGLMIALQYRYAAAEGRLGPPPGA